MFVFCSLSGIHATNLVSKLLYTAIDIQDFKVHQREGYTEKHIKKRVTIVCDERN